MGRILDLFGEVAAAADEGSEGLVLPVEAYERLRAEWTDEDIEDVLGMVHETLLHGELVESADSLSARMVEVLGGFGDAESFRQAEAGDGRITLEVIGQLARRVARVEEILDVLRDGAPPDRKGFDALRTRLANLGIEAEMARSPEPLSPGKDDGEDEE